MPKSLVHTWWHHNFRSLHNKTKLDAPELANSKGLLGRRVFHLGKILEFNLTEKIFKNPDNKLTQDYIT